MEVPADKFLNVSNSLLKSSLELLHEVVYNPLLKDRAFKYSIVEQEKRFLKQSINSLYNEKMLYANGRLVEEMYKDEPYEFPAVGIDEDIVYHNDTTLYEVSEILIL